ncbi:uncharacterized protein LOC141610860 [Silene latifolia]|uniref:uncharacterized protein LOC141610860 n=1 Tax=Silene latifolia TaxID=37657 RepID=UPI003D76FD31
MINEEQTDETAFKSQQECNIRTTTIYVLRPPPQHCFDRPWIFSSDNNIILRHPLTSNPYFYKHSPNFDISNLHLTTLAVSHYSPDLPFDKLVVIPTPYSNRFTNTLLGLYDGGHLLGCHPYSNEWVKVSHNGVKMFDDLAVYKDKVYALDRQGTLYVIHINLNSCNSSISISESIVSRPLPLTVKRLGWRKRVVVDWNNVMYLVVRTTERMLEVYKVIMRENSKSITFIQVKGFDGNQVLFVTKDYYFFRRASQKFPGIEYKNCIVFTEGAFPRYGSGPSGSFWEFSPFSEELGFESSGEEDLAVFRLGNRRFGKVGDNEAFPKIDWSPPGWIFDALSVSAAEFPSHLSSDSLENPGRELEEDKGLDSDSKDENSGEVRAALKDSESEEEYGSASLQEDVYHVSPSLFTPESRTIDTQTPSLSATENEITRALLSLNGWNNNVTDEEIPRKNITELVPRASTSCTTTARCKSGSATTKFEGFDISIDSVSTLEKIWLKHGNIVQNSVMRNRDIIAMSLESLVTMVRILDDTSAQSLSDEEVEYLESTLSDLEYNLFKVDWLIPSIEKAQNFHKSKPLMESLNNLSHLRSQAKDRRAILLEELTKLDVEENKWKEEMTKISKMIPSYGQVKFDEPIGSGLT